MTTAHRNLERTNTSAMTPNSLHGLLLTAGLLTLLVTPAFSGTDLGTGLTTGRQMVSYSPLAKPAKGQRVVDPDFPTTHLVRITDAKTDWNCAAAIPVYPTIQAWNADESLLILYVTSPRGAGAQTGHALFDGRTYSFIRWLEINPADIEQFYWDTNNKDLLYYVDNHDDGGVRHFVLTRLNVSTGVKTALHDFAADIVAGGKLSAAQGTEAVSGGSDPFSMSLDNDLLGLGCYLGHNGPGGAAAFRAFTYRLSTGAISQTLLTEAEVPQAAPSGTCTYYYQDNDSTKAWVLDPTTQAVRRTIAWSGVDHTDLLRNAAGHDIVVGAQYDGPSGSGNLMWADLTTGAVHTILGEATGDGYPTPGTLTSGRAYRNPGWVAVGITGEVRSTRTFLDQEVLVANVDTGAFYRVAHHRSTGNYYNATGSNYWAQPNVTISPSGTRILVQSDWGAGTPGAGVIADPDAIVDTYVIELPAYSSAATNNYAAWRAANFTGADVANDAVCGPSADPDGSGLTNYARYAFSLASRGAVAPPVASGTVDDSGQRYLTLTFPRRATATDLVYQVEASTDLATWTTVATYGPDATSPVTHRDTVALASAPCRFLRLRLTSP